MKTNSNSVKRKSLTMKFLDGVERVGNKLPHPITLFGIFCVAIMLVSAIASLTGVSVTAELIDPKTMQLKEQTVTVTNLLSADGIKYMLENAVKNFTNFAPLGMVLVAMLGVGVAEGTGYISAVLKKVVSITPGKLVTPMVVLLGVMSNIASDAGYVVLVPLGGLIFLTFKRHPLAGIAAAFAGVSGGFSANLLIGTTDPMLGGISTEAAKILNPNYVVGPTANYFFMFVSTFVITIIGTIITEKIVEPRLGTYNKKVENIDTEISHISDDEKKGLKYANLSILALVVLIVALCIPEASFLRNPKNGSLIDHSPLMNGLVPIITILFFVPGVIYGKFAKTIKSEKDVAAKLSKSMASMGGYIALAFVASQFIAYFSYTNLGTILAVKGAVLLEAIGMKGPVLFILFILVTGFINLFIGSASAKWAIMAPIFVPMFMRLGYSPELTQVAYRIGDSATNIISPLMAYFAVIVAFMQKYDEESGIGTLISMMLPFSIAFLIFWTILLVIWMALGLPLGPGAGLFM
ncbi:AbgT family transporter [Clostridium tunisiense]|uniref:AbgT family transporter n=1 Tax=Clostridium tunisiense TaxID=219748 RepID=UPI0002D6D4E8|nr:AbgT family transporter [Clostridium tunisiense]